MSHLLHLFLLAFPVRVIAEAWLVIKQAGRAGCYACSPNFLALPACLPERITAVSLPCWAYTCQRKVTNAIWPGPPKTQALRVTLHPPHYEFKANLGFFGNVDTFFFFLRWIYVAKASKS